MQTNAQPNIQADLMQIRYCALILGVMFLGLGSAAFLLNAGSDAAMETLGPGYSLALGIFPTNYFHNAVRIVVGLLGIAAFTSLSGSITFNQLFAVIYAAIAVLGLLLFTNTLFGTMPIYGNNIWVSALTASIAYYYGFVKPKSIDKIGMSANI